MGSSSGIDGIGNELTFRAAKNTCSYVHEYIVICVYINFETDLNKCSCVGKVVCMYGLNCGYELRKYSCVSIQMLNVHEVEVSYIR